MLKNHQLDLQAPLDSLTIADFVRSVPVPPKQNVLFIIDDPTRPPNIMAQLIIDYFIDTLSDEQVEVLVACGMHRQPTMKEIAMHIGINIVSRVRIHRHNPSWHLGDYVNEKFEDYYVISIGTVIPHTFTGLSGAGKILLPGITEFQEVEEFHSLNKSDAQYTIQENLKLPDFTIQTVINKFGQPCLLWGSPRELWSEKNYKSFRDQATLAYTYDLPEPGNAALLVPWYKNTDFMQCLNAVTVCQDKPVVRSGGILGIDCTSASDGIGVHYIFQPFNGRKQVQYDTIWNCFKESQVAFIVDNIPRCAIQDLFKYPVMVMNSLEEFTNKVEKEFGIGCPINVYQGSDIMIGV